MPQQQSPFLEGKYGWNFGEGGWNTGMDENLLKFSFMFDGNVDSIVASLPPVSNGATHFNSVDNRFYFGVGGVWYSSPCPKSFIFKIKSNGDFYQFNGTSAVKIDNPSQIDSRLDAVELTLSSLGTAAFQNVEDFATQAELEIVEGQAQSYTDVLRDDLADNVDPAKGAGLVGWVRQPLDQTISTVGHMLSAQWVNIWEYAALAVQVNPADPSTWDWQPAIQAAVNASPQVLYFPPITGNGVYYTESPVVVNGPVVLMGTHPKRGNTAGGTRIENRGSGDCITYSDTATIYDAGIRYLGLTATTGGSPLHIKYGAVRCHFTQLYLYSKATNRPCVSADFSVGTLGVDFAGMYSCVFDGGEYIVDNVARTAGIVDMFANATVINENEFKNIWLTQSNGRHAIRLLCTVEGPYLTNNRFTGLTFEVCSGGLIALQGTSHTSIRSVSAWDTPSGYTGNLISVSGDTTKTQNRSLLIENFARVGLDPLVGGAVDIELGFSLSTTIINHAPISGAGAIINAAGRTCTIIGNPNAVVNNQAAVSVLQGSSLNTPTVTTKGGNQFRDLAGGADLNAPNGVSGLSSTHSGSGNSQRIYLDANTFFGGSGALLPAADNTLNLGHTTNRFKTIYAGTGTINTSDGREKQQIRELSEQERAVAARLKGLIRAFKFNDAVAEKGAGARIHVGVIAQDVAAAFAAEGLDATHYAVLCHDTWEAVEELRSDTGDIIEPARSAGDRYGVRYEELLAFVLAAI